jgi:hypothetical protein
VKDCKKDLHILIPVGRRRVLSVVSCHSEESDEWWWKTSGRERHNDVIQMSRQFYSLCDCPKATGIRGEGRINKQTKWQLALAFTLALLYDKRNQLGVISHFSLFSLHPHSSFRPLRSNNTTKLKNTPTRRRPVTSPLTFFTIFERAE